MRHMLILCALLAACNDGKQIQKKVEETPEVNPDANRERSTDVGEELYIWSVPMLENLKSLSALALEPSSPGFKGPPNTLTNDTERIDASFKDVVTPNNDTLYSMFALDLRAEPQVLSVPAITDRYYSFQFIDLYTYNFAYVGTRATGTDAGTFVIAGPGWEGTAPDGAEVIRSETNLVMVIGRTQVMGKEDLPAARAVMERYELQPLSSLTGTEAPPAPTEPLPTYDADAVQGVGYIGTINALLALAEPNPADAEKLQRFGVFGVGPGQPFDRSQLGPAAENALTAGRQDADVKLENTPMGRNANGWEISADMFGTREMMRGKDLQRAQASRAGLWGNNAGEAIYPMAFVDGDGDPLDGSKHSYTLTFPAGAMPPVDAFWSVTMYVKDSQLFYDNPLDRYALDDRSDFEKGPDGSVTITMSHEEPKSAISNWLPTPAAPFYVVLRMYLPKEGAENYDPPAITKVK